MKRKLLTIGYTGFTLEDFTSTLIENGVECLIDIREIPISRKPGFSKSAMKDNLYRAGIEYRHFRALGSPKKQRHRVRATKDYDRFFREVHDHLMLETSQIQLREAIQVARQMRSCLMCCCPRWNQCHRKCVVEAILKETHFAFGHLKLPPQPVHNRNAA